MHLYAPACYKTVVKRVGFMHLYAPARLPEKNRKKTGRTLEKNRKKTVAPRLVILQKNRKKTGAPQSGHFQEKP